MDLLRSGFFRWLIIAGLSTTLLVACGEKEPTVEEAIESAQTHTEEAATVSKQTAANAVQAAKDVTAAAKAQMKETAEAVENAIEDK